MLIAIGLVIVVGSVSAPLYFTFSAATVSSPTDLPWGRGIEGGDARILRKRRWATSKLR